MIVAFQERIMAVQIAVVAVQKRPIVNRICFVGLGMKILVFGIVSFVV